MITPSLRNELMKLSSVQELRTYCQCGGIPWRWVAEDPELSAYIKNLERPMLIPPEPKQQKAK